jgi:hypothetical protein
MSVLFSTSILPLFRRHDIACMTGQHYPINDYAFMSDATGDATFPDHAHARHVYARLTGTEKPQMPPDAVGRWSQDKLTLYQQWMTDGFQQ